MRRLAGLFLLALTALGCGARERPAAAPDAEVVQGELGAVLDAHLTAAEARGFRGAVAVHRGGEVVLRKGYGTTTPDGDVPITPRTLFHIASVTKGFTAALVLRLEELGRLSLGDSLHSFLDVPGDYADLTLEQLLTHTGGVDRRYAADGARTREEAVAALVYQPRTGEAGKFEYADDNYVFLAAVIEVASGKTYPEFLAETLAGTGVRARTWEAVDLKDTTAFAAPLSAIPRERRVGLWGGRGPGGIVASIADLEQWWQALFVDGTVLDPADAARLAEPHVKLGSGTGIGYGWYTSPSDRGTPTRWSRGGADFGHNAVIVDFVDEDTRIFVVTCAGEMDGEEANRVIAGELEELLFPEE